jgi:hypothetical protein
MLETICSATKIRDFCPSIVYGNEGININYIYENISDFNIDLRLTLSINMDSCERIEGSLVSNPTYLKLKVRKGTNLYKMLMIYEIINPFKVHIYTSFLRIYTDIKDPGIIIEIKDFDNSFKLLPGDDNENIISYIWFFSIKEVISCVYEKYLDPSKETKYKKASELLSIDKILTCVCFSDLNEQKLKEKECLYSSSQ